jgi:hypothetical protein
MIFACFHLASKMEDLGILPLPDLFQTLVEEKTFLEVQRTDFLNGVLAAEEKILKSIGKLDLPTVSDFIGVYIESELDKFRFNTKSAGDRCENSQNGILFADIADYLASDENSSDNLYELKIQHYRQRFSVPVTLLCFSPLFHKYSRLCLSTGIIWIFSIRNIRDLMIDDLDGMKKDLGKSIVIQPQLCEKHLNNFWKITDLVTFTSCITEIYEYFSFLLKNRLRFMNNSRLKGLVEDFFTLKQFSLQT